MCGTAFTKHFCTCYSNIISKNNAFKRNAMNECKRMHQRNRQKPHFQHLVQTYAVCTHTHFHYDKDAMTPLFFSLHQVSIVLDIVYVGISGMCECMNSYRMYCKFKLFRWNEKDKVWKPSSQVSFECERNCISPLNTVAYQKLEIHLRINETSFSLASCNT